MLERSRVLLARDEFDADCVEFHNAFLKYELDFAFLFCSIKAHGDGDKAREIYKEITERTCIDHVYTVDVSA